MSALLTWLVLGAALPAPCPAEERQYPTLAALGGFLPVNSSQGRFSPVYFFDHAGGGYYGQGRLSVVWRTSTLTVAMRHPWAELVAWEYRARGEVFTVGNPGDLYLAGAWQRERVFEGHGLYGALALHFFPGSPWRVRAEVERLATLFNPGDETPADYALPPDFGQTETRLRLLRQGLPGAPEAEVSIEHTLGSRDGWGDWALDPASADHGSFSTTVLRWQHPFTWSAMQQSGLTLHGLTGSGLDLFSGFRIGGFTGSHTVAGYFRNEFRARAGWVLNAHHRIAFAADRRVTLFADAARFQELDLDYLAGAPPFRAIAGLGVEYRHGIRSLAGLPVIFRYGHGLGVPRESREPHRQELGLILAVGF